MESELLNMSKLKRFLLLSPIWAGLSIILIASTWTGNSQHIQPWSVQTTLGAADTTKTLRAAPGANLQLVVSVLNCTVLISAAQAVDVEDTSGAVEFLRLPLSVAAGLDYARNLDEGLKLTVNEALIIKPAAAGPSIHCTAEGYVIGPR